MEANDGSGYKRVIESSVDVRLLFKNAMDYNDGRSDLHLMEKILLEKFEEKWLQLLPKVNEKEKETIRKDLYWWDRGMVRRAKCLEDIDQARALYKHSSQFTDPRSDPDFWNKWHELEVQHGNKDIFREMLHVKRSVSSSYIQVLQNSSSKDLCEMNLDECVTYNNGPNNLRVACLKLSYY
ncbi:hypothetical protein KY290_038330 [Solanum tuberosum]|uniref:Pre-mRNA-splicing factor Syf1/CRNKL1-like C-terminal HAT-repeats domain-containing protein n=1 Tax=Solanum tuberosum TaxID=4113 RepID=A0ABQ7U1W3_SOLTU|nr:hypothetical protein KY285_035950 [Solanum tuberosum]KAH0739625.1 hypothetical protein KY290_038330 [Solanum tuberosum]